MAVKVFDFFPMCTFNFDIDYYSIAIKLYVVTFMPYNALICVKHHEYYEHDEELFTTYIKDNVLLQHHQYQTFSCCCYNKELCS